MKKNYTEVEITVYTLREEDILRTSLIVSEWDDLIEDGANFGDIFS